MRLFILILTILIFNSSYSQQVIEQCDNYRNTYTYYAQSVGTLNDIHHWIVDYNGLVSYYSTETIELTFLDSGFCNISVSIEDENTCESRTQKYEIDIIPCRKSTFYIPNSFTPNNDGINDIFEPKGKNVFDVKMRIYNRWGELIFESVGFNGWDGSYYNNNYYCQNGVYCYVIFYRDIKSKPQMKIGNVTLIR